MTKNPGRLFCFGMPKCGTTTVAALLDAHPAICLHNQKEPGDFLQQPPNTSLAGYAQTADTRWLADFTTTYGLTDRRSQFFAGLRNAGIDATAARYVLCLRDPTDLCRSYLRHIAERRSVDLTADIPAIRAEILSACDFEGARQALTQQVDPDAFFVVKFNDLASQSTQHALALSLHRWLGLDPQLQSAPVWANASGSLGSYPVLLDRLAAVIRRVDLIRRLSPQTRSRIRQKLSRPPKTEALPQALVDDTVAWLEAQAVVKAARAVLQQTVSGPATARVINTST